MWFAFPKGYERISVERQEFASELEHEGVHYFRAPDHFSTRILAINGFTVATNLPEGAPPDLPKADPIRDGAITELTLRTEGMKDEIYNLQADLTSARAQIAALMNEKTDLGMKLQEAQQKLVALEETIEDAGVVVEDGKVIQLPLVKAKVK